MLKAIMFLPFHLILKPLIKHNYKLRREGKLPDEWHWADRVACDHGYYAGAKQ